VITDDLTDLIRAAILAARDAGLLTLADSTPEESLAIKLEMPPNKQFGDYSTNVALTLKKATGINDSRVIANAILQHLPVGVGLIERAEVAGPGFLNFYLKPTWLQDTLLRIEAEQERYGTSDARVDERVLIEFVSANPTGPISVVNGRAAALGDVLANLLAAQGCTVGREFYINDALNSLQLETFAQTVMVRYLQQLGHPVQMPDGGIESGVNTSDGLTLPVARFPEKGYRGEYVKDIAAIIVGEIGERFHAALTARFCGEVPLAGTSDAPLDPDLITYFREATLHRMLDAQRQALAAFGIHYDRWYFESSLYESGAVEHAIATLRDHGYTYEKDGALWFRSSAFGDTEDRVLVRSNEKATYIAADAAYHNDKFQRGYTHLIDIFGADHHGYVARLKAGIAAMGYDLKHVDVILTQMVSLVRDGEAVLGGKRKGNIMELKEDLVDDIGRDAARFYFLLNSYETPATVDVELAKKQSNENPVYYVQYAHARLCNILRRAAEQGFTLQPAAEVDRALLTHPRELDMLRKLSDYPQDIAYAAERYAPHRLTRYAMDMAGLLNLFYENCRVLPGRDEAVDPALTQARLALVNGARIVLHNLLTLLGISAPETM
jgi:arginyl-tRNA synthetase